MAAVHPSGASAARGSSVDIVPSTGPRLIAIPAVAGFSQAAASRGARTVGLAVRPQTAYDTAPSGTAIATAPAVGTAVPPHSSVALTISAGPAPVTPPAPPGPGNGKRQGNGKDHEKKKPKGPKGPKDGKPAAWREWAAPGGR